MGNIFLINQFGELLVGIGSLIAIGVAIYFIIRYQTVKFLREVIKSILEFRRQNPPTSEEVNSDIELGDIPDLSQLGAGL